MIYSLKVAIVIAMIVLLSACAPLVLRNPAPIDIKQVPILDGKDYYRFSTSDLTEALIEETAAKLFHQRIKSGIISDGKIKRIDSKLLALSGGGAGGAYSAGLLYGWTEAGTRPEFTMVTGVSTGSLAAPFAFLGSDYDEALKNVFTNSSSTDIFSRKGLMSLLRGDSANDNLPLRELIETNFNRAFLDKIAEQHQRGRRLIISTTNLDKKRPYFWDMGAIASSKHPDRLRLFHDVILASASIPVMFPPVYIPVEINGESYDEMHVDGGVSSQVFIYPLQFNMTSLKEKYNIEPSGSVYVIRNTKLLPDAKSVRPVSTEIASASLKLLTDTQGLGDIIRIYATSIRDQQDFHLAFIPENFNVEAKEAFDPVQMKALFRLGRDNAANGYDWSREIAGFTDL